MFGPRRGGLQHSIQFLPRMHVTACLHFCLLDKFGWTRFHLCHLIAVKRRAVKRNEKQQFMSAKILFAHRSP